MVNSDDPMFRLLTAWLLVLFCSVKIAVANESSPGLYLHVIPTDGELPVNPLPDNPIRLKLYHSTPKKLALSLGDYNLVVKKIETDSVTISLPSNPHSTVAPTGSYKEPSFVVDFDQPDIGMVHDLVMEKYGVNPSVEQLVEFVYAYIDQKSFGQGFDIGSEVARSKAGDCTEHAVLLTSLARASGLPAKIVFGILLVQQNDQAQAVGHAWTEVYNGQQWILADGTKPEAGDSKSSVVYVPVSTMSVESTGFTMGLFESMSLLPGRVAIPSIIE